MYNCFLVMRSSGDFSHGPSHIHALALIAYRQLSFTSLFVKSLDSHMQLVSQLTSHGYHVIGLKLKERLKPFWDSLLGGSFPIRYGNQHPPVNREGWLVGGQETVFYCCVPVAQLSVVVILVQPMHSLTQLPIKYTTKFCILTNFYSLYTGVMLCFLSVQFERLANVIIFYQYCNNFKHKTILRKKQSLEDFCLSVLTQIIGTQRFVGVLRKFCCQKYDNNLNSCFCCYKRVSPISVVFSVAVIISYLFLLCFKIHTQCFFPPNLSKQDQETYPNFLKQKLAAKVF